jgi:hypothetical protein
MREYAHRIYEYTHELVKQDCVIVRPLTSECRTRTHQLFTEAACRHRPKRSR